MTPRARTPDLRDRILDEAEALLLAAGTPDAVSIRAVCDAVGVTQPTIYRHFADKDALFFDVCSRRFADLAAVVTAARDGAADPLDALRSMAAAYVEFGLSRPETYRILFGDAKTFVPSDIDPQDLAGVQALQVLVDAVAEARDAGAIVAEDASTTAVALWAAVHGVVMIVMTSPEHVELPPVDALLDEVLSMVMRGLQPR